MLKDCEDQPLIGDSQLQYGSWLRAQPTVRSSRRENGLDKDNWSRRGRGRGNRHQSNREEIRTESSEEKRSNQLEFSGHGSKYPTKQDNAGKNPIRPIGESIKDKEKLEEDKLETPTTDHKEQRTKKLIVEQSKENLEQSKEIFKEATLSKESASILSFNDHQSQISLSGQKESTIKPIQTKIPNSVQYEPQTYSFNKGALEPPLDPQQTGGEFSFLYSEKKDKDHSRCFKKSTWKRQPRIGIDNQLPVGVIESSNISETGKKRKQEAAEEHNLFQEGGTEGNKRKCVMRRKNART